MAKRVDMASQNWLFVGLWILIILFFLLWLIYFCFFFAGGPANIPA
jgi:hypothetical protein